MIQKSVQYSDGLDSGITSISESLSFVISAILFTNSAVIFLCL
jgi:hypothetical protein